MRKPTQQEIDDFIKYRANHVALVQKLGKVALDMDFSDHDADKIDATGKDLDLLALRNASKKVNLFLSKEEENELRKVSAHHALNSKHHAEHWDPNITVRNFKADDTDEIHATRMPKKHLAEMACDWASCALYHNEPLLDWYNKVIDATLFLTENQKEYLLDCLNKIKKAVIKNNIQFPGVEYTCEQVNLNEAVKCYYGIETAGGVLLSGSVSDDLEKLRRLRDELSKKFKEIFKIKKISCEEIAESTKLPFTEKILKVGSKWKVTSEDGSRNFGTYNTKAEAEKRLKQIHYFKHINESLSHFSQDYTTKLCTFIVESCINGLNNFERDKILLKYYQGLALGRQGFSEEELNYIISDKKQDLQRDLGALKELVEFIQSFEQSQVFKVFDIEGELLAAIKEGEGLITEDLQEEVSAASVSGQVPEHLRKVIDPSGILEKAVPIDAYQVDSEGKVHQVC